VARGGCFEPGFARGGGGGCIVHDGVLDRFGKAIPIIYRISWYEDPPWSPDHATTENPAG
jgi:hypothetical protein